MRILHAPINIAGQPYVISRALRDLGHSSDVLVDGHHQFGYRDDIVFDFDHLRSPWRQVRKGAALVGLLRRYDIFHFYFGASLFSEFRDLPLLRRAGKRIVFHFRGCEIRMRTRELAQRELCACSDCPAPCASDEEKSALRDIAWQMADDVLVSTPDLLEWVPGATLVGQAIDLSDCPPYSETVEPRERYVIVHAPSDPLIKGTRYLQTAVARLQADGYPIELKMLQGRPHAEVRAAIAEADIVVDQLMLGWYGNFAIEAMAGSKPVVACIRDDLCALTGLRPPILSANSETIQTALASLVDNPGLRTSLAQAGRSYVASTHEAGVIAAKLVDRYTRVLTPGSRGTRQ